jgi:hypothetical protein
VARVRSDPSAITTPPQAWGGGAIVQTQDGTLALLTRVIAALSGRTDSRR